MNYKETIHDLAYLESGYELEHFRFRIKIAMGDIALSDGKINEGDPCVTLHIRKEGANLHEFLVNGIKRDFASIANHIQKSKPENIHVVGVSHSGFKLLANRLGFSTTEVHIAAPIGHIITDNAQHSTSRTLSRLDNPHFVMYHQSGEDFVARFGEDRSRRNIPSLKA